MPRKDFYMVLGIPRTETPSGIRSAFRDLARRYHPDRAGPRGTRFFQEILEAYQILSNPKTRDSYDEGLRHAEQSERIPVTRVTPHERSQAEPLIPEPLVPDRISLMHDFEVTRPSRDEVFERLISNFVESTFASSRNVDALNLQIRIGTEQAARGGVIALGIPVFYPCPQCRGSGATLGYACYVCGNKGMIEEEEPIEIRIPPMVRHNTTFEVPLRGLGIHNLFLRLRILVGDP